MGIKLIILHEWPMECELVIQMIGIIIHVNFALYNFYPVLSEALFSTCTMQATMPSLICPTPPDPAHQMQGWETYGSMRIGPPRRLHTRLRGLRVVRRRVGVRAALRPLPARARGPLLPGARQGDGRTARGAAAEDRCMDADLRILC